MNYLFVHQNFPGQFKHIAPTLAKEKGNRVIGFTMNAVQSAADLQVISYKAARGNGRDTHELLREFETKVIRGEAAYRAAIDLRKSGFYPDAIIAHPGWGESLFLKDVWPDAKLGIYCEFFYKLQNADVGFDPEFSSPMEDKARAVRMKNVNNIVHMEMADAGISPTLWQASTFPMHFRDRISVIHDGIVTTSVAPKESAFVTINGKLRLDRAAEIITFVNRNLEPYRGYHVFMRSLPQILKARPNAHVIIVGGDGVSYGSAAPTGATWKQVYLNEVKNDLDLTRVHFVGNLSYPNFISLLQVSSVHVYLTYPFVLSWSLLEAMSAGCTIVASDTPPVKEVISSGINGVLVDFFDHEAIASQVIELISNSERRRVLGSNARELIVNNYDLQSICLPKQLSWVRQLASSEG
jgi:glycosyltransferase involved in cell wall biosynthesis